MRQRAESPVDFQVHRVLVDDVPSANIISSFDESNNFIHEALARGEKVLVHCVAGQSRSATLLAAYLLQYRAKMTTEKAIALIRLARPTVEPSEAFMEQLEMYERSLCEWNPSKWPDQRRLLMRFMTTQVLGTQAPYLAPLCCAHSRAHRWSSSLGCSRIVFVLRRAERNRSFSNFRQQRLQLDRCDLEQAPDIASDWSSGRFERSDETGEQRRGRVGDHRKENSVQNVSVRRLLSLTYSASLMVS